MRSVAKRRPPKPPKRKADDLHPPVEPIRRAKQLIVDCKALPHVTGLPAIQKLTKIRCQYCNGPKVLRVGHLGRFLYYRCNNDPVCVDSETMDVMPFKVLAVDPAAS